MAVHADIADASNFGQMPTMLWRVIVVGIIGLLTGWWARYYFDTDACLDAGGRWETRGSYCYGARSTD